MASGVELMVEGHQHQVFSKLPQLHSDVELNWLKIDVVGRKDCAWIAAGTEGVPSRPRSPCSWWLPGNVEQLEAMAWGDLPRVSNYWARAACFPLP